MKLVDDEKALILRLGIAAWTHRSTLVCHFINQATKKRNLQGEWIFQQWWNKNSVAYFPPTMGLPEHYKVYTACNFVGNQSQFAWTWSGSCRKSITKSRGLIFKQNIIYYKASDLWNCQHQFGAILLAEVGQSTPIQNDAFWKRKKGSDAC